MCVCVSRVAICELWGRMKRIFKKECPFFLLARRDPKMRHTIKKKKILKKTRQGKTKIIIRRSNF